MTATLPRKHFLNTVIQNQSIGTAQMSGVQSLATHESIQQLSSPEFLIRVFSWFQSNAVSGEHTREEFQEHRRELADDEHADLYPILHEAITKLPQPAVFTASDLARIVYYSFAGQLTTDSHPNSPEAAAAIRRYRLLLSGELDETENLPRRWDFEGWEVSRLSELCRKEVLDAADHQISLSFPEETRPDTFVQADLIRRYPESADMRGLPWEQPWWTSDSGFQIWLLPGGRYKSDTIFHHIECLGLIGFEATATIAAIESGRRQMLAALKPILRTIADAATSTEKATSVVRADAYQDTVILSPIPPLIPTFAYYYWGDGGILLRTCLDAIFKPGVNDLDQRIHNSVSLLANSDVVDHAGVSLALCIAAIESLMTSPGDRITEVFANSCATILQPDVNRRQEAIGDLKRMFDYRSSVLHGRSITADSPLRDQARQLAAGVLRAVASLKDQYEQRGDSLTRKELRSIVELCCTEHRPVPGLADLSDLLPADVPKLATQ